MTVSLCQTDEEVAFDFLKRAIPILCDARIMPPTLSILDSLAANPNAYGLGDRPALKELAAEWASAYTSPGLGAEPSPETMRELVFAALGADAAGNYDMGFRTWASDETEHWNLAGTPLAGVPAFGLYLIKEGERTYCCSLTPSSWAVAIENVFLYPDQSDLPKVNGYGQTAVEAYMDAHNPDREGLEDGYFGFFGDREDLDKREREKGDVSARISFDMPVTGVDLGKLAEHAASPAHADNADPFADLETLAAAFYKAAGAEAWEAAREYVQGNAVHPRVLFAA